MSVALVKTPNAETTGEIPVVTLPAIEPDEVVIAGSSHWLRDPDAEVHPIGWALALDWDRVYKELEKV